MIDDVVHAWFQSHRVPWATQVMLWLTWLHGTAGLLAMGALLALVIWRSGDKGWIPALAVALPGAMLLNVAIKHVVQRARPVVEQPLLVLDTYSFPSGHAAGTAALYTFAAAWLLARLAGKPVAWRAAGVAAAVFMAVWVSISRLYLGVHFVSDVLAGMLLGLLWTLACLAARRALQTKTSR